MRREHPRQADVLALLDASDRLMASLYPADSNHLLDVGELEKPEVSFYVARLDSIAVGCGAWVRVSDHEAEMKRMFVSPAARGRRIGRSILETVETAAICAGVTVMRLETGIRQPEAISLYRSGGYIECGPFPPYVLDPLSVFMTRRLPDDPPRPATTA